MARRRILVSVLRCPLCGGYRTLHKAWVRANADDPAPKGIFDGCGFCLDCNEEVALKEKFVTCKRSREIENSY